MESWKKKYPEKSEKELLDIRNLELKNKLKGRKLPNQLEYWLSKGFSEEYAKLKIIERQKTFSLKKCIEKYGEDTGIVMSKEEKFFVNQNSK